MKAKHVNPDKTESIEEVSDNCSYYESDMDTVVVCPSCGKRFVFGKGYTSYEWFDENGVWALCVCPDCHSKEMKRRMGYISGKDKFRK